MLPPAYIVVDGSNITILAEIKKWILVCVEEGV
jgi:hypothetical protein